MNDCLISVAKIPEDKVAYVDETGFDQWVYRTHGRSKRGEKILGLVSGKQFQRTSLVVGLLNRKKLIVPLQYEGTMDSALFELWFTMYLIPELPTSSVVIIDNARFHRKTELKKIAIAKGHLLLFYRPIPQT